MLNFFKKKEIKKKEFVFTTRNIANRTANGELIGGRPTNVSQSSQTEGSMQLFSSSNAIYSTVEARVEEMSKKSPVSTDERKAVNPKDVFKEIKTESPDISFENLDQKIEVVEERLKILGEHLKPEELIDEQWTLFYLKARKRYLVTRSKDPLDWAMTTREAIDDLCKRYKLRVVPLKQYYTTVPKDGIKEIARYTKAYKAITGDNPIFELVIKDAEALPQAERKQVRKKDRDPILLANSPLGNHIFVLGAWDDEVAVVDEIIYGLK